MNSAPVQLLPIENGGGYKKASSEPAALPDEGKRFSDVFKETSSDSGQSAASDDVKSSKKIEEQKTRNKTAVDDNRKNPKKSESEGSEGSEGAAAVEGQLEKAVDKLKKGLSRKADDSTDGKEAVLSKGLISVKQAVKKARAASNRGAEKTMAESGLAAALKQGPAMESKEADSMSEKLSAVVLEKNGLASKLKVFSDNMKTDSTEKSSQIKAGIKLMALKTEGAAVTEVATANDGKKSDKNSKGSKLKIVDHRHVSTAADKAVKTNSVGGNNSFTNEVEASAKVNDFTGVNSQSDAGKTEGRTAETKMFQSSVLSQLKDGINSEIVKQAGIVVKGNGTGEIKLIMKPENLGKVRIQLSMNNNHIAGRIIVENNIVREIFESNLENLYKAFGSEGFENGGLEVTVQGKGQDTDGNGRKGKKGFNGRAVKAMDEAVPELTGSEWRNNAVNMVV